MQVRLKPVGAKRFGAYKNWNNDTTDAAGTYNATRNGLYEFRSRVVNTVSGNTSGWSPASGSVKVTG